MIKIFFVPCYFYLSSAYFEKVIMNLDKSKKSNIDAYILKITDYKAEYESNYNSEYYKKKGILFLEVGFNKIRKQNNFINKLIRLFDDYNTIKKFINNFRPDAVVVTSDLGDLHIRYLLEICRSCKIPIYIIYTLDPSFDNYMSYFKQVINRLLYIINLQLIRIIRARIFNNDLIGSFYLGGKIYVLSENNKTRLLKQHICQNRIQVVENELNNIKIDCILDLYKKLDIPKENTVITLFTECIDEIYGEKYAKKVYSKIANIFNKYQKNYITILVKYHPREKESIKAIYNIIFKKFKTIENIEAENIIYISDLNIAHYSAVLITAAFNNKKILSINIKGEKKKNIIPLTERNILEAKTIEELELKIKSFIEDPEFCKKMEKSILKIATSYHGNNISFSEYLKKIYEKNNYKVYNN